MEAAGSSSTAPVEERLLLEEVIGLLYWSLVPVEFTKSRAAVAEARRQIGNPEERKLPALEASTRGLVKRQQTKSVLIGNC
jgi:hypothetical protein